MASYGGNNLPLSLGDNIITVTATDNSGNVSSDIITVTRNVVNSKLLLEGDGYFLLEDNSGYLLK